MDVALVQHVNRLCRHLAITPARLHPHEVYLDPTDTADPRVSCLMGKILLQQKHLSQSELRVIKGGMVWRLHERLKSLLQPPVARS